MDPVDPEAGQPFTVRAGTAFNSGHVAFTYNGDTKSVPVSPLPDNKGYAEYTFIADAAATGDTAISATLFGVAGISDATKTATVNVGMPATYHTVVFRANGDNVYTLPAPQTVKHGEKAVTPVTPERKGYTFGGWYKDAACTNAAAYTFADPVTKNLELYAKWEAKQVKVIANTPTVASAVKVFFVATTPLTTTVTQHIGANVTFYVTVPAEYDPSTILAYAGYGYTNYKDLAPVAQSELRDSTTGNVTAVKFQYQFELTENLVDPTTNNVYVGVYDTVASKTFTVMMPTGHFDAEITGATPAPPVPPATGVGSTVADDKKSASIVYGGGYTFTVTPKQGYDVEVYVNGAKKNAETDGSYLVKNVTGPQSVVVVESAIPNFNVTFTVPLSGQTFTQSVARGKTATRPGVAPEREGYTFAGWYTDDQYTNGTEFDFGTPIIRDTILYGKLTPNTYTITYDLNDASGTSPTTQAKTHGLAEKLSETVPTREGYTFLGWGTTASATAASYQPGDMYSVDGDITLYAVWQRNTYTVTLPSGTGYSISYSQSTSVAHGEGFEFTITVDGDYAANVPTVSISDPAHGTLEFSGSGNNLHQPGVYHCKITNVTGNQIVSVSATENERVKVTFSYRVVDKDDNELPRDALSGSVYSYQSVQIGDPASQPELPKLEGYRFVRWSVKQEAEGVVSYPAYTFVDPVMGPMTVYAEMTPITPVITWPTTTKGYEFKFTAPSALVDNTSGTGTVAYKDVVTFTITIADGYDASKMLVGINGVLLSPKEIDGSLYTYEFIAKEDTKITVTGIERKTVTVIYNANARDDVSGLPSPQVVKYYLAALGKTGNDKITTQVPSRTGYTFLGWNTDSEAKEADARYTAEMIRAGAASEFTQDTTLYAIWEADELTAELIITDEFTSAGSTTSVGNKLEYAYEGDSITLVGKLSADAQGTMTFYKKAKTATDWTFLGTTSINGGNYGVLGTTVENYKWGNADDAATKSNYRWDYKVEFKPTTDEGYSLCDASDDLRVYSKAISWEVDKKADKTNFDWIKAQNELTIYTNEARTAATDKMTANSTYWLQIPTVVELDGGRVLKNQSKNLSVGTHYEITWEYEDSANHWTTYTTTSDTDWVKVTPEYSGYSFRAKVTPTQSSIYTKAATYDENGTVVKDVYWDYLITKATAKTEKQSTATALEITGADAENSVTIAGTSVTTGLAQFEGKKVTLTAKVTDTTANAGVKSGEVKFYRYVDGTNDELLNTTLISVDSNGVATCEVEISKWTAGKSVTENKDEFYAVYLANATYDTSDSKTTPQTVYIKSTTIQTPIIESTLANEAGKNATTYTDDLTGLLAGVQHEFKLRQTGAEATTGDWSVVALDGRTVDTDNYDIEWQYKTGANFDKAGNDSAAVKYTTTTTKVDDRYRVKLTGKGVFAGSEATSKDAVIGTKQDVTVTVKAIDAITKTPVDRENGKYPDVYQLNEITLTATVAAAKGADATMKPAGTVTFYYSVDGNNWTKIGEAKDLAEVAGVMTASIKTDQLPVKANDNTKQDVKITAVYSGDATFNASATVNETEKSITAAAGCTTTNDTVTVYSSVVFNCNDENKKQTTNGDKGIHISVSDGAFKTNEKATLALSDIYTLDRELTGDLLNTIAKLNPTTDYTVQWQKLNGATAIGDAEGTDFANSKNWTNIDGKTGTTLVLDKVEQNTAYRAVITVNDQPITKGSFGKLDQGVIGTADANDGRQVYYSNVLMPTDTSMTVSVALNTSKIGAENTEGITEGETVTANVYLSGVVGAVPNANVTVTVTNDDAKGNGTAGEYKQILGNKNTVNGWNAFDWDTTGVTPGFYTLTVSATTNTGYAAKEITRSLIVRESSYNIEVGNTNPTYNGRTQGLEVTLDGFDFKGTGINEAANKSWTVRYEDANGNPVEPTQAGTYKAVITLPASAYWTEQRIEKTFTIKQRSVSIADAIAQAKVYDGTTDVNIVEVMLNDAVTDQTTNGTGLPTNNVGIINGDSIYAVATEAKLSSANAGDNSFTISTIDLRGDDAANYVWNGTAYTEDIYVSRSQVYGEHGTLELKQGETFPADKVIKMIDQSGREITLGTGTEDYTLTFYYHSDTKIEKTTDISKLGLYTVVARPNQSNYKSGVTMQFTVVETATNLTEAATPKPSTLIYLSDTATKYNPAGNVPVTAKNAQGNTVKVEYHGTTWSETVPSYAGRYLVKATDTSTGDVAYGIYTITKAHPSIDVTPATDLTYNSKPQNGYTGTPTVPTSAESYFTYAGDVAIGYNVQKEGNVDEQAPVDAGTYTVTLHVNETANYTAHEISKSFTIAKKALTIKADSWQTTQYDAFPDMTAGYTGLAAETGDTTPDTSLRDVQIAPEFLYNPTGGKSNYSNDSLDQVGGVAIQPIDALSKNYAITYENGQYTKQRTETNVDLDIHGLPQSSTGTNTVYYGDVIQLYPYGYYTTHANGSGIFDWSVTTAADFKGTVTIGKETGLLNVNGVGEFTVTLKRGVGEQQIKTEINVTAIQKEAKIALKNVDKVYTGASQTYDYTGNVTVHDELYHPIGNFVDSKLTRTSTDRIDVGTQVTTAKVTSAWAYQSETYGGKFTINDKDATVAPGAQSTVYGTLEAFDTNPKYKVDGKAGSVDPVTGVNVASQTDAYNRLDVHDGYEILVAGTEDMNYNVKYTTDETAEDSAVTTYGGMKLYSTTTKAKNELNDATVYGEQANDLDWILDAVKSTTRDSVDYADNLADFDLTDTTGIFIKQDKDDCVGNAKTYKAANREEGNTSSTALAADRTATDTAKDDNYELKFGSVTNAKAANYTLANAEVKNAEGTMTAPTGTVGFIGAAATSDNLIEGSANIAQRPIKLEKAVTDAQLYWRLPQSQLYTALVNILKAEENSVGRGLAKGHTIEDLDLSFTIKVGSTAYNVAKDDTGAINFAATGNATVTATVGDTNYKLEGGQYQFDIVLKNIQIEATYTTKTFTGFTVLIKVHNENGTITPLNDAKGLSYKIFKKTGNTIDKTTAYASGTLTYQNRTAYDDKGGLCGVFTATYPQLPLLNSGETYFIQMYEYGVELKTNS